MRTREKLGLEWTIVFLWRQHSREWTFRETHLMWTKVDLTWREVLEDVGGEILGDDHHLAPGSTQVAILVLVLRSKVLKVLKVMEFL